jgi:hypothetical protein
MTASTLAPYAEAIIADPGSNGRQKCLLLSGGDSRARFRDELDQYEAFDIGPKTEVLDALRQGVADAKRTLERRRRSSSSAT